jgi:hypothetical protein
MRAIVSVREVPKGNYRQGFSFFIVILVVVTLGLHRLEAFLFANFLGDLRKSETPIMAEDHPS